jgi:F-type H+-transporting ATPase subunit b
MDATFWALIALVLFVGILLYAKVPGLLGTKLDARADAIKADLDDARRLREEAQELLAEYQRKKVEAENEARAIVEQAKREAEIYGEEARKKMAEQIERRTKLAEQKIAQAEAAAVKDVRAAATELAIEAASKIIGNEVKGAKAAGLVDNTIAGLKKQLN